MKKTVPLNEISRQRLMMKNSAFEKGTKKRWTALFVVLGVFYIIYYLILKSSPPVMFHIFFALIIIAFFIVTKFLSLKFRLDLQGNVMNVYEGKLDKKEFRGLRKNMTNYEIDTEKKVLRVNYDGPGSAGTLILNYDKDNFDGMLDQGDSFYFTVDSDEFKVDATHFAYFEPGERIQAEQLPNSGQLLRIVSLDEPNKIVETKTVKFV